MSRRGFTLVELTVVTLIILLTATLVAPRLMAIRTSGDAQLAQARLLSSIGRAREVAASRGETITVGLDARNGIVNLSSADSQTNDRYSSDQKFNASMTIDRIAPLSGKDEVARPEKGEAHAEFYSDGSMPASAEITLAGKPMTIRVRGDGTVTIGGDADASDRWRAGEIEQRG
ncbi:MAG: hypothetical protein C4320_04335 [Armatimonadota bacterium]